MNTNGFMAIILLSSISLSSCQAEKPRTQTKSASTIIYLKDRITRTEDADKIFNNIIRQGNVVVDYYADWCGPCKMISRTIEQIASSYPSITFLKINTDQFPSLSAEIRSIPTIIFYKQGQQISRFSGTKNQNEFRDLINTLYH